MNIWNFPYNAANTISNKHQGAENGQLSQIQLFHIEPLLLETWNCHQSSLVDTPQLNEVVESKH